MIFNADSKKATLDKVEAEETVKILERISPLIKKIYSHSAMFAIHKGINNLNEIFFYLLGLACIAFSFIMNTIFPFHVLGDIISKRVYEQAFSNKGDIELFNIAVKGLVILIGILFIFIGILIRNVGKRKTLLQEAGKELKNIEAYYLESKKLSLHEKTELKNVELKEFPKGV